MWDGPRYGLEGAISFFKADEAKQISTFPGWLSNKLMNYNQTLLFSNVSNLKEFNQTLINFNSTSLTTSLKRAYFESQFVSSKSCMAFQIQSLSKFIEPIRNVKSEAEIRLMQIAGDMSAKGFNDVLKFLEPGVTEHQVGAVIEYRIKMSGGSSFSYEPVVAGGRNALTLHYVVNQQVLK